MSVEDRILLGRTRTINKILSMFVLALQECSHIPAESRLSIADMLVALADTVRQRASKPAPNNTGEPHGNTGAAADRASARRLIDLCRAVAGESNFLSSKGVLAATVQRPGSRSG